MTGQPTMEVDLKKELDPHVAHASVYRIGGEPPRILLAVTLNDGTRGSATEQNPRAFERTDSIKATISNDLGMTFNSLRGASLGSGCMASSVVFIIDSSEKAAALAAWMKEGGVVFEYHDGLTLDSLGQAAPEASVALKGKLGDADVYFTELVRQHTKPITKTTAQRGRGEPASAGFFG